MSPEFKDVNQCDLYCPRKALLSVELREEMEKASLLAKGGVAIKFAVEGVAQMKRTMGCPENEVHAWEPQVACIEHVSRVLATQRFDTARFNEYEQKNLGPYMHPNPFDIPPDAEPGQ